jgi:hypothetical protein
MKRQSNRVFDSLPAWGPKTTDGTLAFFHTLGADARNNRGRKSLSACRQKPGPASPANRADGDDSDSQENEQAGE